MSSSRADLLCSDISARHVHTDLPVLLHLRCSTEHLGFQSWINMTNVPVTTGPAAQGVED